MNNLYLRFRLIKKAAYRNWKKVILNKSKRLIGDIEYDSSALQSSTPFIILCNFNSFKDFLIISSIFIEKDLSYIAPKDLPDEEITRVLKNINHVIYMHDLSNYSVLRGMLKALRDYNRSIVISFEAAKSLSSTFSLEPATVVRLAMKASVPILPVTIKWPEKRTWRTSDKCSVRIHTPIFISPRVEEFKDIFFKFRGVRKFQNLPKTELETIAARILSRLEA